MTRQIRSTHCQVAQSDDSTRDIRWVGVWKQVRLGVSEDSNVHEELEKLSSPAGFQPEDFVHAHGIWNSDETFGAGHRSQREWAPRGSLPQQPVLQYKEVPCERNHADHLQGVQICLEAATGHP